MLTLHPASAAAVVQLRAALTVAQLSLLPLMPYTPPKEAGGGTSGSEDTLTAGGRTDRPRRHTVAAADMDEGEMEAMRVAARRRRASVAAPLLRARHTWPDEDEDLDDLPRGQRFSSTSMPSSPSVSSISDDDDNDGYSDLTDSATSLDYGGGGKGAVDKPYRRGSAGTDDVAAFDDHTQTCCVCRCEFEVRASGARHYGLRPPPTPPCRTDAARRRRASIVGDAAGRAGADAAVLPHLPPAVHRRVAAPARLVPRVSAARRGAPGAAAARGAGASGAARRRRRRGVVCVSAR